MRLISALFMVILATQTAIAGERVTVAVGGPYTAAAMDDRARKQVLGLGLMKAFTGAGLMLKTSADMELILVRDGTKPAMLPIPLDSALRFAEALQKGINACTTNQAENGREELIDRWTWKAMPVRFNKHADPVTMAIAISTLVDNKGNCEISLNADTGSKQPLSAQLSAASATSLLDDIPKITAAGAALETFE